MNYRVLINGNSVPVFDTPVLPVPYNHTVPQRFVTVRCPAGGAEILVESDLPLAEPVVRPLSLGLRGELTDERHCLVRVPGPANFSLEFGGDIVENLLVFLAPERDDRPDPEDPGVLYFGPGDHRIGHLCLTKDDLTVYLDEGAHLLGKLELNGCRRVTLCGLGRIDDGDCPARRVLLDISGCEDITIRDITLTNSTNWNCRLFGCERVRIENLKILGWHGNSDGVDVCSSRHVTVEDLFTRVWDDSLVVKAFGESDRKPADWQTSPWDGEHYAKGFEMAGDVYDLLFFRCALWNDFARPMEIGVELRQSQVYDVIFRDIDVLHTTTGYPVMGCHHGDRADVHDILFEDIRIEDAPGAQLFDFRMTDSVWSTDAEKGRIRNVTARNIDLLTPPGTPVMPGLSRLEGWSEENDVSGFRFENIRLMGKWADSPEAALLDVRDHARDVTVVCTGEGPRIRPTITRLDVISPFLPGKDGRLAGKVRLTVENRSSERVSGSVRLTCAPVNMLPEQEPLSYDLAPGGTAAEEYDITLQPGRYLLSAPGETPEVSSGWILLTLEGRREGFVCDFRNYYGDEPGSALLRMEGDRLIVEPRLREDCEGLTLYAANRPDTAPGEVLFTCEETDFGLAGAVILGPHGPEPAPQLRCPAEITYVFHNEPKTGPVASRALDARAPSCVDLREMGVDPGRDLLLELAVDFPASKGRRYPCTLFHSVAPAGCAHMFVRVPAAKP